MDQALAICNLLQQTRRLRLECRAEEKRKKKIKRKINFKEYILLKAFHYPLSTSVSKFCSIQHYPGEVEELKKLSDWFLVEKSFSLHFLVSSI